mgnify:CR=1 FL=1
MTDVVAIADEGSVSGQRHDLLLHRLGARRATLRSAVAALPDVVAVSPVYETEPWGVEPGTQPAYFNAVALVKTTLPPSSLLERAHAVEEAFGRPRVGEDRSGPRRLRPFRRTETTWPSDVPLTSGVATCTWRVCQIPAGTGQ